MFTLTDKTLLDRAARMINASAKALRLEHESAGWASTEAGKKAKAEYDRLLRDERDMRSLGKRMCLHFDVKASTPVNRKPGQQIIYGRTEPGQMGLVGAEETITIITGNPQSTSGPQGDTVEAQPHLGGEDVGF